MKTMFNIPRLALFSLVNIALFSADARCALIEEENAPESTESILPPYQLDSHSPYETLEDEPLPPYSSASMNPTRQRVFSALANEPHHLVYPHPPSSNAEQQGIHSFYTNGDVIDPLFEHPAPSSWQANEARTPPPSFEEAVFGNDVNGNNPPPEPSGLTSGLTPAIRPFFGAQGNLHGGSSTSLDSALSDGPSRASPSSAPHASPPVYTPGHILEVRSDRSSGHRSTSASSPLASSAQSPSRNMSCSPSSFRSQGLCHLNFPRNRSDESSPGASPGGSPMGSPTPQKNLGRFSVGAMGTASDTLSPLSSPSFRRHHSNSSQNSRRSSSPFDLIKGFDHLGTSTSPPPSFNN